CRVPSAVILCILACGRQRTSCSFAGSAVRPRLPFIASRSTSSAGVSISLTLWPTSPANDSETVFVGGFMVQVLRIGPACQSETLGRPQQAIDGAVGQFAGSGRGDFLLRGDPLQRVE